MSPVGGSWRGRWLRTLPPTEGFFFGVSDGSEADDDLAFVAKARGLLCVVVVRAPAPGR